MKSASDSHQLDLAILQQPDDASCGPTCLHAVYRYFEDEVTLEELIAEVPQIEGGGTLAVNLANHALRRGYRARIVTYNLALFDPSWFTSPGVDVAERLEQQARSKADPKLATATTSYLEFLRRGGELAMEDLTSSLLCGWLEAGLPILTGLSATFLYRSPREVGVDTLVEDDVRGQPTGHFVVLCGWDGKERRVQVADPLAEQPGRLDWVPVDRVLNAVLLGVLSYDANLLVLEPAEAAR